MTSGRGLFSSALLGALDQALLSAFNLLLGLAFIRLAPKSEYALYVLLTTGLLLAQSVQNAIVASPLTTLWPGQVDDEGRRRVAGAAARVQRWLTAAVLLLGLCTAVVFALADDDRGWTALAVALGGAGLLAREYTRARLFLRHQALAALLSDAGYVAVAVVAAAWLAGAGRMQAAPVLAVIGVAGMIASWATQLRRRDATRQPFGTLSEDDRRGLAELWDCARWALPSVVSSWLYANAFLYVVEAMMSKDAVAELSAARLMLVPLSLLVVGWSNAFRPRASRWLAGDEPDRVERVARRSAAALVGVALAYGLLLAIVLPLLQEHVLGRNYAGLAGLMALWLAFFAVSAVRNVGMSSMLASRHAFRPLFVYGLLALAVAIPGTLLAGLVGSRGGVLVALTMAEAALAAIIWLRGWPALRRTPVETLR